jgi:hypothetical protein
MVERGTFESGYESVDAAEQTLVAAEFHIARLRGIQLEALEVLDRAQVATGDGAKSLAEWVTARADVSPETARDLVRTMRRTDSRPELRSPLVDAEVTFDRVVAAARIDSPGDPLWSHLDVAGVRREAARRHRIDDAAESRSGRDRFLVMQPSLDESWWRLFGGFDGATGAIVDQALAAAVDQLPPDPEAPSDAGWKRATALAVMCVGDETVPSQITVFVDTDQATTTNGQAGVYLEAGPRIGRQMLEAVLCDSVTEVVAISGDGTPMTYGRRTRSIPPALRRAVLRRDGNRCAISGCDSRNRLQVHHIIPWSRGGPTDPENLITLCWYHHHIAIHQHDLTPYRHPVHGRWRLRRASRAPPE